MDTLEAIFGHSCPLNSDRSLIVYNTKGNILDANSPTIDSFIFLPHARDPAGSGPHDHSWTGLLDKGPLFSHVAVKKNPRTKCLPAGSYEKGCFWSLRAHQTRLNERGLLASMSSFALAFCPNRCVKIALHWQQPSCSSGHRSFWHCGHLLWPHHGHFACFSISVSL